jgi:parallel beta-helix repeat protein
MKAKDCEMPLWLRASQIVLIAREALNAKHLVWCLTAATLLTPASLGVVKGERSQHMRLTPDTLPDRVRHVPARFADMSEAGAASFAQSPAGARYVKCDESTAGDELGLPAPLQSAIDESLAGGTILVSGTCHENVTIPLGKDGITLEGGGTAAITATDPTQPTVVVRAKDITIRSFTITGGFGGIIVTQGGMALIDGNTIRDTGSYGVGASQLSSAVIVNNVIRNNFQAGIGVAENSYAFIGFVRSTDTVASPNVITGNRAQGIVVFRGSYARIVGNDISNNGANGVNVRESSSAQISDNIVNGNGANGILVAQGSGVLLGADTGNTIFTRPNTTTTNNAGFGIRCQVAGYADGRRGTLNGNAGPEIYTEGCVASLLP